MPLLVLRRGSRTSTGRHAAPDGSARRRPKPWRVVDVSWTQAETPAASPRRARSVSATGERAGWRASAFRSRAVSASSSSANVAAARIAPTSPRRRAHRASSSAAADVSKTSLFLAARRTAAAARRRSFGATLWPSGSAPSARACRCRRPVFALSSNHRFVGCGARSGIGARSDPATDPISTRGASKSARRASSSSSFFFFRAFSFFFESPSQPSVKSESAAVSFSAALFLCCSCLDRAPC